MAFVKHGDAEFVSVIDPDKLEESQKKAAEELAKNKKSSEKKDQEKN